MTIKQKITTGVASTALLLSTIVPAAFADFTISGNGSRSDNQIDADFDITTRISQRNDFDADNDVRINNNTGDNRSSGNTGGDVSIDTGNATANVDIVNVGGSNIAHVDGCGCSNFGDFDAKIYGNGSKSDNEIDLDVNKDLRVYQTNDTNIDNNVYVNNNTGDNKANDNTGGVSYVHYPLSYGKDGYDKKDYKDYDHKDYKYDWLSKYYGDGGEVSIETGDAEAYVDIHNIGGKNILHLN